MSSETVQTGPTPREARAVVVAYDGSAESEAALRWAAREAAAAASPLDVVVSVEPGLLGRGADLEDTEHAQGLVSRAASTAEAVASHLDVRPHVERGGTRVVLLRRAEEAGLVVLAVGGNVGRFAGLLGGVSRSVVERVEVPLVLVGTHADVDEAECRIVLVSRFGVVDGGAATWAVQRARSRDKGVLHLLDTWSPPGLGIGLTIQGVRQLARRQAVVAHEHTLEQLRETARGVPVTGALYEGRAADIEFAHGLPGDLLVISSGDIGELPPLTRVRCPVAVVPPLRNAAGGAGSEAGSSEAEPLVDAGG